MSKRTVLRQHPACMQAEHGNRLQTANQGKHQPGCWDLSFGLTARTIRQTARPATISNEAGDDPCVLASVTNTKCARLSCRDTGVNHAKKRHASHQARRGLVYIHKAPRSQSNGARPPELLVSQAPRASEQLAHHAWNCHALPLSANRSVCFRATQ
jgi:hypothetical protein